jgi:hypothetical protein
MKDQTIEAVAIGVLREEFQSALTTDPNVAIKSGRELFA